MGKVKTPKNFGRYQVSQVLASGGMATVYVAQDPVLTRTVAIKVLHPHLETHKALLKRFDQEAKTVAQLRSPFIVEIHDFGKEDNSPYLVMELVDGLSLDGVFQQLGYEPMDPVVAAALMCQAAEGLETASQKGVVHRDIKPDNLLISPKGYLKIADFGIAHVMNQTSTKTGAIIGTASYMSPEQADGAKGITSQSDLFSLGSVFYNCLTGRAPFKSESVPGMLKKIVFEPHQPIQSICPQTDPFLADLVETLLQKDPLKRGDGASWLKGELKRYLLNRQVADPVERIKAYLKELGGRGIQTTGFVSPLVIGAALRAREIKTLPPKASKSKTWIPILALLLIGGLSVITVSNWQTIRSLFAPNLKVEGVPSTKLEGAKANNIGTSLPNLAPPAPIPLEPASEPIPKRETGTKLNSAAKIRRVDSITKPRLAALEPLPPVALKKESVPRQPSQLSIDSKPPFADVTLDGKRFGTTPIENGITTSGRHTLSLVDQSGTGRKDTVVDLQPGAQHLRIVLPER